MISTTYERKRPVERGRVQAAKWAHTARPPTLSGGPPSRCGSEPCPSVGQAFIRVDFVTANLSDRLALRPREAAEALGLSERKRRELLPELPHVRRGGVVLLHSWL